MLELVQTLSTSGARAVTSFTIDGAHYLAIAQLAADASDSPRGMNGGDSDISTLIYQRNADGRYIEYQQIPVPGGEDVEYFSIDGRHFLATASLRSGKGPYSLDVSSVIFEWSDDRFVEFQRIPSFGAKQWRYFTLGGRHFLALAQGLQLPDVQPTVPAESTIFEWNGAKFEPFQTVPSAWGYNWLQFDHDGTHFLAYADFRKPSILLRWDGSRFVHFQTFQGTGGRAFSFFTCSDQAYLAFADIQGDSLLYRWQHDTFELHQKLAGPGGREFALIQDNGDTYLVLVRFIVGSPKDPVPVLESLIYRLEYGFLKEVERFVTHGATDVLSVLKNQETFVVVCESLTEDVRFRVDTKIYRFTTQPVLAGAIQGSATFQSPEFLELYAAYTGGPGALGPQLATHVAKRTTADPLLVCTASDFYYFPGCGKAPTYLSYRLGNRGFKELAAISHLGPALASLVEIYTSNPHDSVWQTQAQKLLEATVAVGKVNTASLWRDRLQVKAFENREDAIAKMVDYACTITIRYLRLALEEPDRTLTPSFLQREYLEAKGTELGATVPLNAIMIATFFLVGLDISYRMRAWLLEQHIDWRRAMVLIVGRQGRETSGVTISTNSVAQVIIQSSDLDLPPERLYLAPHGPTLSPDAPKDIQSLRNFEVLSRSLWNKMYAIQLLGETMFAEYPRYKAHLSDKPLVSASTTELSEMPQIRSPDDWLTLNTRMRLVLEDARQLLSGCVTEYAAEQLRWHKDDLKKVVVPGLDNVDYNLPAGAKLGFIKTNGVHHAPVTAVRESITLNGVEWATEFSTPCKKCPASGGGEIAFYEEGHGDAVVIWLHGLPLDSRSWAAQRPHFQPLYRNIYVDLRGYGQSTKFPAGVTDPTQVNCNDLLALMDHLSVLRAHIVGFASAGHAALRFAAQHPDRVDKLVTLNASPCFRQRRQKDDDDDGGDWPWGFTTEAMDAFIARAERDGIDGLLDLILGAHTFQELSEPDLSAATAWFGELGRGAGVATLLHFFHGISHDDDRALMGRVCAPTLLIAGSRGLEVPSGAALFLRQHIPRARLVEVPDADHFLFITRPAVVNALVEGFLASS